MESYRKMVFMRASLSLIAHTHPKSMAFGTVPLLGTYLMNAPVCKLAQV
jgi:hypothetical protein